MTEDSANYTVLARRFRPQTFDDVVGQQNVAQALRNAIVGDRVAHGYLFTGARGVGKTSMARIFAKALNCSEVTDGVPCNSCEICEGITSGNDVDVLEIDGASHTGVDDVRQLRANAAVKSMRTRYKMYIIDEVHMLSKSAFNALLKTLEEPPGNVVFVFCTTEPEKVPDTIRSRCQRFDFSTIETQRITEQLIRIAEAEGYEVGNDVAEMVARRAAGSMRDSQSLFDQLLAFGEKKILADDVHRLLGTAPDDRLREIFDAIIAGQPGEVLTHLNETLASGAQIGEVLQQLLNYARDLMVLVSGSSTVALVSVSDFRRSELEEQAKAWGLLAILSATEILAECLGRMRLSGRPRVLAEMSLVRISLLGQLQNVEMLIQELRKQKSTGVGHSTSQANPVDTDAGEVTVSTISEKSQKKNPESTGLTSEPASRSNPPISQVALDESSKDFFIKQLQKRCEDVTDQHLSFICDSAIFGPNHLVLTFPADYSFSYDVCRKPENLRRLQQEAELLAGQSVRIEFRIQSDALPASEANSAPEPTKPSADRRMKVPDDDSFLKHVLQTFDARLVKAEPTRGQGGSGDGQELGD